MDWEKEAMMALRKPKKKKGNTTGWEQEAMNALQSSGSSFGSSGGLFGDMPKGGGINGLFGGGSKGEPKARYQKAKYERRAILEEEALAGVKQRISLQDAEKRRQKIAKAKELFKAIRSGIKGKMPRRGSIYD